MPGPGDLRQEGAGAADGMARVGGGGQRPGGVTLTREEVVGPHPQ